MIPCYDPQKRPEKVNLDGLVKKVSPHRFFAFVNEQLITKFFCELHHSER